MIDPPFRLVEQSQKKLARLQVLVWDVGFRGTDAETFVYVSTDLAPQLAVSLYRCQIPSHVFPIQSHWLRFNTIRAILKPPLHLLGMYMSGRDE